MKESRGWELVFTSPHLDRPPNKIAINAKVISNSLGDKMLAYSIGELMCVVLECYILFSTLMIYEMMVLISQY